MCTNYVPTPKDRLQDWFDVPRPEFDYPEEAYPLYRVPMICRAGPGMTHEGMAEHRRVCLPALFGLVPHWSKDTKIGRHTYNARAETVDVKPSYRTPWRASRLCLVPMEAFFESSYAGGKPERWKIALASGAPFASAGIWDRWIDPATGLAVHSFSLLTINADAHPVLNRFQPAGDEKRSLVIVRPDDYDAWLDAPPDAAREFLGLYPASELVALAAPRPPRLPRATHEAPSRASQRELGSEGT